MQHPSTCQCGGSGKIGDWEKEFDAIEQCGTECGFSCGGGCPDKVKSFIYALQERHEAVLKRLREKVEAIKTDMDVVVCDCGEPYKHTDPYNLVVEALAAFDSAAQLNKKGSV